MVDPAEVPVWSCPGSMDWEFVLQDEGIHVSSSFPHAAGEEAWQLRCRLMTAAQHVYWPLKLDGHEWFLKVQFSELGSAPPVVPPWFSYLGECDKIE